VSADDFVRPRQRIPCSDPAWLWANPQFKVLGSIVVADPVEVMNAFVWEEESPELLRGQDGAHVSFGSLFRRHFGVVRSAHRDAFDILP